MMTVLPKANSTRPTWQTWQKDMQLAFRTVESLLKFLELEIKSARSAESVPSSVAASVKAILPHSEFPILVTRHFAEQMEKGNWHDPLLRQVLPLEKEKNDEAGFVNDAVGDLAAQVIPGLLHKYSSRALMMISPLCAIHCRYCFRREFPYGDLPRGDAKWEKAWNYLSDANEIDEIIFSGGDPLFLSNQKLKEILDRAMALPKIKTIRFHTRMPVVLPSRVDEEILRILHEVAEKKSLVMVIHSNHANELSDECGLALTKIKESGALLLNQTVLLKGINDDTVTLTLLSQRLFHFGVLPYYLHQLDRVKGTAHFEVDEKIGFKLVDEMRKHLAGYLVPRYVREVAGEMSKSLVAAL